MRENEAVDTTETVEPEPFSSKAVLDKADDFDPAYVARYDLERVAGALTGAYADLITVMRESLTEQHWAVSGIRSPEHWLTCFAEQVLNEAKNALFQQTRHTDSDGDNDCERGGGQESAVESDQDTTAQRIPAAFGGPDPGTDRAPDLGADLGTDLGDGLDAAGKPRITLADAFLEAMLRSLHAGTGGVPGRADTYRVLFHLDAHGHGWSGGAGALPPALREKLSCDGLIVPIIEKNGYPVDVGRTQRIVPRRTRRLVHDRDHGCRFPGCGTHRYVEVHHVIHWSKGGNTDLGNLISLCPFHHDRLHAADFTITALTPGFFVFRGRYGDRFGYRPPDPATPPGARSTPTKPAKPYERQSWEPLNLHWIEFHNTG
ncbi:HNH endonuclease signature motif containing protein [Yimella sp. NH-Cas1]|uniref:HNH endonuclease signature motif containing protein n=1 Tax=Yimella sp. NH-Cas1 TaxID=2917726 RepID=UPI001EFAEE99|nr:HNH endonuclease signature motif containing protein [Yimella sp. NH-Cas1]MCG8655275.1 HNH endonuclease [Yimella sp. NH-Cas1]